MRHIHPLLALFLSTPLTQAAEPYQLGKDSMRQEGVPRGEVSEHVWKSQVFPGTIRRYWVYVPAENDPAVAAPVMVFQDGVVARVEQHRMVFEGGARPSGNH